MEIVVLRLSYDYLGTWRLSVRWKRYDYNMGMWRSSMRNLFDLWIFIKIFHTDLWRSSVSVYGPRESLMVINSRCMFEEYHVYTVERVLGILRYITSWCNITLHHMTFLILDDYVFFWWLESTWYLFTFILWTWSCVLLILWVPICESCDCWILSLYLRVFYLLKMILMSWVLWKI